MTLADRLRSADPGERAAAIAEIEGRTTVEEVSRVIHSG